MPPLHSPLEQYDRAARVLVLTSSAFDYQARRLPAYGRHVGTPFDDAGVPSWTLHWPPEDVRPLVLVSLSTLDQGQGTVMQRVIESLGPLPVRGVVTLGPALDPVQFNEFEMNRRAFLCRLALGTVAAPLSAEAQQAAMPLIGVLHGVSATQWTDRMVGFHRGLAEAGFAEGRNVGIEYRWAEGHFDRLPAMAADLVSRRVRVISAGAPDVAIRSAMGATNTIPIVFMTASDPVRAGFVSNLGRPEGNVTGVTLIAAELSAKRVELLHEIAPSGTRVALLVNPNNPGLMQDNIREFSAALHRLGLEMLVVKAGSESEIESAFAAAAQQRAKAMHIGADAYLSSRSPQVSSLALRYALPTSSESREGVAAGLLMSYGQSHADVFRQLGLYVGRICRGAKPAELPVLQPTKFELVINVKTSKALGLTLPQALLLRVDELIQ